MKRTKKLTPDFIQLDRRDLPSVSVAGGMISIIAPQVSNNTAVVSVPSPGTIRVVLDGVTTNIPSAGIIAVYYQGGSGGHDTFANNTSLVGTELGRGGFNNFTGGSGMDMFSMSGDFNTIHTGGGLDIAFLSGGQNDTLDGTFLLVVR